ncbi:UNVERIFIED_CONTAM: E3 ubiquitin-protein ligase RING1 [Sesamum angustifolium]|uniref:RING-type E3 ubiquitin transferase n=1 Tax=Sesamum angustifolium TaxID=2727405 RepID=A0AAW2N742_9LAMI
MGPDKGLAAQGSCHHLGSHTWNIDFVSSFKYKKDESVEDEGYDSQCAVCLSVFEEGEEVRQLPKCNHLFHAQCIDMWLYSHMDCPLCRSPVEPPISQRRAVPERQEHSREGLLGPSSLV